jgi:voltage-gated sodium channel
MDEPTRVRRLAKVVDSPAFAALVLGVIVANAIVLGLQTYDDVVDDYGGLLDLLNDVFLGFFVGELALRMASYGRRPHDFFREPWNVFDFVIIAAAFIPGLRSNSTLLRLARMLRVVRVVRLLPELRVLTLAMARSLPPLFSMAVLTTVILFVYGMVGWVFFGDEDPERWGDIGEAMLTLFVLLTLENLPSTLEAGMEIEPLSIIYFEPLSIIYFVTFVLVAALIVLNVLIGVVLHSMQEARAIHAREELLARGEAATEDQVALEVRIERMREALDELERELVRKLGR